MVKTGLRPSAGWLAWVEWAALLPALALWLSAERFTPWMAAGGGLAALAWLAHFARTGRFIPASPLDWPLAAFLVSALVGVWAAPDRGAALVRLTWIFGAAALFYALLGSPPKVARAAGAALAVCAAGAAVYFVTQNQWASAPIKIEWVGQMGQALNRVVPDLGLHKPHPNVAANLLAVLLPVAAALAVEATREARTGKSNWWPGLVWWTLLGVAGIGLLFTESRASILAVTAAATLAGWWWAARATARRQGWPFGLTFAAPLAGAAVLGLLALWLQPSLATTALGNLPGPNSVMSRIEVFGQAWRLAQDVPVTGGGLASFPARYASYILVLPSLFLTHAHNAYLNVLIEQGWLGLVSYAALLGTALWTGARRLARGLTPRPALTAAGLLGLVVMVIQGVGEATQFASRVAPVLLVPAGLALWGDVPEEAPAVKRAGRLWPLAAAGLAGLALAGLGIWRPAQAAWYANRGALVSDRWLLAGFPTSEWRGKSDAPALRQAEPNLMRALELDPDNRTAHFYLGLAAAQRHEFDTAVEQLAAARRVDPEHRGLIKLLGYCRTWLGEETQAAELLKGIPEARSEMDVYAWWWGTQGRADLAARAADMARRLRDGQ